MANWPKPFLKSSELPFGKYRGLTIEQVWCGTMISNEGEVIQQYLQEVAAFFTGKLDPSIKLPATNFALLQLENQINLLHQNGSGIGVEVSRDRITMTATHKMLIDHFATVLLQCFGQPFTNLSYDNYGHYWHFNQWNFKHLMEFATAQSTTFNYSSNSYDLRQTHADPDYIRWCLENVDRFYLSPEELKKLTYLKSRKLTGIQLRRIGNYVITYLPVFDQYQYEVSSEIIDLNQRKYESGKPSLASGFDHYNVFDPTSYSFDDDIGDPPYCDACMEAPCMCSDRERTSTTYDL